MRALEPEVFDVVWTATEPLIPPPPRTHPLGCHRPRVSDRLCLWGMVIRLVTGCFVGDRRSTPRLPGLGHDLAGPT